MVEVLSLEKVKEELIKINQPCNLLLGNGFSTSYDGNISYEKIHRVIAKYIEINNDEILSAFFEVVKSKNIENILYQMNIFYELYNKFEGVSNFSENVIHATKTLKEFFIETVNDLQLSNVNDVNTDKSEYIYKTFLSFFLKFENRDYKIFSTNYDLLLYWILMINKKRSTIAPFCDGFDSSGWGGNKNGQNIFYLHGNLCIFKDNLQIIKKVAYDGLRSIKDQITDEIRNNNIYPIYVAAGDSSEKKQQIDENKYLRYCYNSLCEIQGSLVTFGFGFSDADAHILEAIKKASKDIENEDYNKKKKGRDSKLHNIYIGIYKESEADGILTGFQQDSFIDSKNLNIRFFNTRDADIWGRVCEVKL